MPRRSVAQVLCAVALAMGGLRGDTGDVENSHDYAGFPRMPGFLITDFAEDNPADFAFPIAHPLPTDSGHVENVTVTGHRFVIRYEFSGASTPSMFQAQRYYEKLASDNGFAIEKTGAAGDTTETFHKSTSAHEIWIYLEPAITVNVLTVMETAAGASLAPPEPPRIQPTIPPVHVVMPTVAVPHPAPAATLPVTVTPVPATGPSTPAPAPVADADGEALFAQLTQNGRVVVPFVFQPGRDDLDTSSSPLVARIVAMMKKHTDLFLRIEGHTDNNGDPEAALRLSAQRAFAVQAALVKAKVEQKRLDAVGVGGLQPIADNTTAQGREKNRRIELVLWKHYSHTGATQ